MRTESTRLEGYPTTYVCISSQVIFTEDFENHSTPFIPKDTKKLKKVVGYHLNRPDEPDLKKESNY